MTGLSASTLALMLHLASAALAMQCGFVREIAAALTAAKTVDENALLVDAYARWTSCALKHFGPGVLGMRCCSPSRQEPFAQTRLQIFALGRMDRKEERYKNRAGRPRCVTSQ